MSSHAWHIATHARPTFCNVCREALSGVTSSGYSCGICKYKAHKACASNVVVGCKWTTLNSVDERAITCENGTNFMHHQWIEGNLPVAAKCAVCDKTCGSVIRLQDWRCLWCRACLHSTCRGSFVQHCSLGETRPYTVPPTCLMTKGKRWQVAEPLPGSPMIVFVNCKSGGGHGERFLRRFKQILNPGQVFDIANEGPAFGLEVYRYLAPLRLLVCGGDGSVGWVLKEIDKLQLRAESVCVSVLPLGTGNDLARVCGWGSAIEDDVNLISLLEKYEVGSPRLLDRWSIMSVESATVSKDIELSRDEGDQGGGGQLKMASPKCAFASGLTCQQKEHLLKQLQQLRHDLDEKFMPHKPSLTLEEVEEKSDHEKLEKHMDDQGTSEGSDDKGLISGGEKNVEEPTQDDVTAIVDSSSIGRADDEGEKDNYILIDKLNNFLMDLENIAGDSLSNNLELKRKVDAIKEALAATEVAKASSNLKLDEAQQNEDEEERPKEMQVEINIIISEPQSEEDNAALLNKSGKDATNKCLKLMQLANIDKQPIRDILVEIQEALEASLSVKPTTSTTGPLGEPTILITDTDLDNEAEGKKDGSFLFSDSMLSMPVPADEDELLEATTVSSRLTKERPTSLIAVVKPVQQMEDPDDIITLSRLPSPMERSGSIVGDHQLPVPDEFSDLPAGYEDDEEAKRIHLSPVSGVEAAIRSRLRLSNRLCSVPEKHSVVSFVQDIRRMGLEPDRRTSSAGLCTASPIPNPSGSKATLEPADAADIVVKRRGSRRLSVGALVGLQVFKDDSEVIKKSKATPTVASSYGSTSGVTQGGVTRIRNKTIPIINPMVKSSNWPSSSYKRDLDRSADRGLVSMVVLASADALCAPVTPIMDWTPPPDKMHERSVMNNYFGIGIDAKISLDFHNKREENPVKSRSRAKNYMLYGVLGSRELVQKTYKNLEKRVIVECDGEAIPLPSLQGIVVLNISSFMGGTNFWGSAKDDNIFLPPSFDDGILEVVAVFGSMHMGASRLVNLQRHRIAQCRSVVIRILGDEGVPVQVDGEAWLHPPGIIRILHKNRVQLVCRDKAMEQQLKGGVTPRTWYREHAHPVLLPLDEEESHLLRSLIGAARQFNHHIILIHHALDGPESRELATLANSLQDAMKTVTPDGILSLDAPELRRRSAIIVNRLRQCIEVCKRVLLEKFQDTQCDAAGKLSQSIYVVESLLGKCHQEGDLLFFTIRQDPQESGRRNSWFRVPKFGRSPSISLGSGMTGSVGNVGSLSNAGIGSTSTSSMGASTSTAAKLPKMAPTSSSCMVEIALQWSPNEVSQWLEAIGLPMYCHAFLEHEISGTELMSLERSDFKDVGVTKVGHIKKLQKGIRDIQNGKMPRRLLHASCGITSVSYGTASGTSTMSYSSSSRLPSKAAIFDDFDSYTMDTMASQEESFG